MSSVHLPMINIAKVSDWLTNNTNKYVWPQLFLMSPNGTLLAYSKPVQTKELRDQAALISMTWKDHCQGRQKPSVRNGTTQDHSLKPALKTLTIETPDCNIIVRLLQPELLLVLIGRIAPSRKQAFKISAEGQGDPRYPESDVPNSRPGSSSQLLPGDAATGNFGAEDRLTAKNKAPSLLSNMSQRDKDIRGGALHVQRKQLDALAEYALKDFAATGTSTEVRQVFFNVGNGDSTLLAGTLAPLHEDNGEPEQPRIAAPAGPRNMNDGSHNADYKDSARNEVDPGSNIASYDAQISSNYQESQPLPQVSPTRSQIPTPTVQRGSIRVRCCLKPQPAPFTVKKLAFGQFRPQDPRRAELDHIWRITIDVERRQWQMGHG
ncbi:hypothetical protein AA0113_g5612 [Alternaria arborescens]|uniref:Uncharacterized protein n=1 Tax=Alternaria arborescens TaxID=156630 RepID=A0A4Q4S5X4_9PLEO|nr:hypothetical protein AA0113_g5612 [Alternaria arborescens]